jgi:formylmethanofuran dehydrogenase subunit A
MIHDPWKVYLTTDHPNAAPFVTYPRIISWLMSTVARQKLIDRINSNARRRSSIDDIEREYDFHEIAIVTRAGTAKALGLTWKGHLGVGADADIAIYNINPRKINPSQDYQLIRKAFEKAAYTIKGGEIVSRKGDIVKSVPGKTYWVDVKTREPMTVNDDLIQKFEDYWTVQYNNYVIPEDYLHSPAPIPIKAEV